LHPSPGRTLKAVFPRAKPHKQQVADEKKENKEKPSDSQKPKKAQQR
jgi:hypothetical protein